MSINLSRNQISHHHYCSPPTAMSATNWIKIIIATVQIHLINHTALRRRRWRWPRDRSSWTNHLHRHQHRIPLTATMHTTRSAILHGESESNYYLGTMNADRRRICNARMAARTVYAVSAHTNSNGVLFASSSLLAEYSAFNEKWNWQFY